MLEKYGKPETPEYAGRIIAHLAQSLSYSDQFSKLIELLLNRPIRNGLFRKDSIDR